MNSCISAFTSSLAHAFNDLDKDILGVLVRFCKVMRLHLVPLFGCLICIVICVSEGYPDCL